MRLAALALVLFAACSDDTSTEPQFETVACDADWNLSAGAQCQAACEHEMLLGPGGGCLGGRTFIGGGYGTYDCTSSFEWEGVRGCCLPDGDRVYFVQCD